MIALFTLHTFSLPLSSIFLPIKGSPYLGGNLGVAPVWPCIHLSSDTSESSECTSLLLCFSPPRKLGCGWWWRLSGSPYFRLRLLCCIIAGAAEPDQCWIFHTVATTVSRATCSPHGIFSIVEAHPLHDHLQVLVVTSITNMVCCGLLSTLRIVEPRWTRGGSCFLCLCRGPAVCPGSRCVIFEQLEHGFFRIIARPRQSDNRLRCGSCIVFKGIRLLPWPFGGLHCD